MVGLIIRQQAIPEALKTLVRSLILFHEPKNILLYKELRDSVIKIFEYSIDTLWKYIREYLEEIHKVTIGPIISPKAVFRASLNIQLISQVEFETLLLIIDDRNLTSHTYNEELAEKIGSRIKDYCILMESILQRMLLKND